MVISLIVAMSENGVIGRNNALPWHLPDDLKRFKHLTLNHTIIMGRKTFESIGKPLPQRRNIVVTRDPTYRASGAEIAHSIEEAIAMAQRGGEEDEVFIIGGAELFREAIEKRLVDRLYVTLVHAHVDGDVFMPPVDWKQWKMLAEERHSADAQHMFPFSIQQFERCAGASHF